MAASNTAKPNNALVKAMAVAFSNGALPGENDGFDGAAAHEAARFMLQAATSRKPGKAAIVIDSHDIAGDDQQKVMRIAINNEDMPFLVDSISAALASMGLHVLRIIHPVVASLRDKNGVLNELGKRENLSSKRESFIYIETNRVDAKQRREVERILQAALNDVRAAVTDWPKMLSAMADDAAQLPAGEDAELMNWFIAGNMTVLGHERLARDSSRTNQLGLSNNDPAVMLSPQSLDLAFQRFDEGSRTSLILKSNRVSSVHRNVPLDLFLVPIVQNGKVVAISLTAGLWTSAALASGTIEIINVSRYGS